MQRFLSRRSFTLGLTAICTTLRRGVIYEIDHVGDQFFIRTNLDAPDFRLMIAPEVNPDAVNWKEIIPQTAEHYLSHFEAFETFIAVEEAEAGTKVRAFNSNDASEVTVPHPAGIGVASISLTTTMKPMSNPVLPSCGSASADPYNQNAFMIST